MRKRLILSDCNWHIVRVHHLLRKAVIREYCGAILDVC